jgi:hypothetical protein
MNGNEGGLLGLAQTVLAVSLAYLALEKFKYTKHVSGLIEEAKEELDRLSLSEDRKKDKAWIDMTTMHTCERKTAWSSGFYSYWALHKCLDRCIAKFFAVVSSAVLLHGGFTDAFGVSLLSGLGPYGSTAIVGLLAIGLATPVCFTLAGNRAIAGAKKSIAEHLSHISKTYRKDVEEKVDSMLNIRGKPPISKPPPLPPARLYSPSAAKQPSASTPYRRQDPAREN